MVTREERDKLEAEWPMDAPSIAIVARLFNPMLQHEEPSMAPAVVTCVLCAAGTLAAVLIATGSWLA